MPRAVRLLAATLVAAVPLLVLPVSASAHGIAQRADLPIPAWLFAWGAALVLLASFVALAILWPKPVLQRVRERPIVRVPVVFEVLAGLIGIAIFGAVVYAGFAGSQTATANLTPTVVYVLFWVGVPFATIFLGDVFAAFSPWRAIGRGAGWVAGRVAGDALPAPMAYPQRLGRWPAALGILAFAWVELIYIDKSDPSILAALALTYAIAMLVGMTLYGVAAWTERADPFGVYFRLFSLLAPLHWSDRELRLRKPLGGAPLMLEIPGSVALVCIMIGSTSFDGFTQGSLWTGADGLGQRLADAFGNLGLGTEAALQVGYSVGLFVVIGIISGLYRLGVAGMHSVGGERTSNELARRFAHSLVPIAFAYIAAHYFSLLVFQGQATAFLISDPLGDGSDLFGTAQSTIDYNVIGANGIWYAQVAALVCGHVAGLTLAHDRALATWKSSRRATRSQYWMLLVMIAYTCLGLWLLSSASQ